MAIEHSINPWRNNEYETWPFSPKATLRNSGGIVFPSNLFVDAVLHMPGDDPEPWISLLTVTADGFTISITGAELEGTCQASHEFTADDDILNVVDSLGRPAGIFVLGASGIASVRSIPIGSYRFYKSQTLLAGGCVVVRPESGLRSIRPQGTSDIVYGDVWLAGGVGVILTVDSQIVEDSGETVDLLKINATGENAPTAALCGEEELDYTVTPMLTGILFVDSEGTEVYCESAGDGRICMFVAGVETEHTALRLTTYKSELELSLAGK